MDIGGVMKCRIPGVTFENVKKKDTAAAEALMLGS